MRHAMETAPRDGTIVTLEDDASRTYDVARWSAEAGRWVGENGEPSEITPTHWHQRHANYQYSVQEDERQPRRRRRPRRLAAFPIMAVGFLMMGVMGLYFIDSLYFEVFHSETKLPIEKSHKTGLTLLPRTEADQAKVKAGTQVKRTVEAPPRELRQSVMTGQSTERSLPNEHAENWRAIDRLDRQPQKAENSASSIEHDQHRIAALVREATAARQELTASTGQYRQALEEERARSAALASALATAQREIEVPAAQSQKAVDEALQQKQAAEATIAEMQQSLQQEQKKTANLIQEAKAAQLKTTTAEQQRRALEEAQARAAALASELAGTRREIETQAAQSQKAVDEALQQKQAAEATIAEMQQSLQQAHQRAETLSRDLGEVRREREAMATLWRQKHDRAAQLKRIAETTTAELQESLQRQREKAEALEGELAKVRQSADAQVATPPKTGEEAARTKRIETATSDVVGTLRRRKSDETASNQAAEDAKAELRPSPPQKRAQPKGITLDAETARRSAGAAVTERGEAAGLLARAKALVGQGNIRAARDVLERAAETGSAQATFALAETYDPNVLATWRTRGTRGDATKARDLYAKAYDGGIKAAKDRSQALVIAGDERKPASWFGREEADHR